MYANDRLEPANTLRSNDLPGNEDPGDVFPLSDVWELEGDGSESSNVQELEGDGSELSEDDGEDFSDWIDGADLGAAHPGIATDVAADVTEEDVWIDPTPALNQAQQAEVEQSQEPDLLVEVEHFGGVAGKPIKTGGPTASGIYHGNVGQGNQPANIYAPFNSQTDWEFAKWAKLRGPTSTAVTDLLNIPGVSTKVSSFDSRSIGCPGP